MKIIKSLLKSQTNKQTTSIQLNLLISEPCYIENKTKKTIIVGKFSAKHFIHD